MTQTSTERLTTNKRRGHPQTNPRSLANLRPGNPPVDTGKHGYSLKSRLLDALSKSDLSQVKRETVGDEIVIATLRGAIDLVPVAVKETWDRVEGSVAQQQPAGPVVIVVKWDGNRNELPVIEGEGKELEEG